MPYAQFTTQDRLRRIGAGPTVFFSYPQGVDPRRIGGTFARPDATTCATYIDVNGVVQTVAANIPRNAHFVPGQTALGPTLLLEGSRKNHCLYGRDLSNAAWTKRGTASCALTATGVDGTANSATNVTGLGASGVNDIYQAGSGTTIANTARFEPSFYIKKVTASGTMQMVNTVGAANGQWAINFATLGSGWERITRNHAAVTVTTEFTGDGSTNNQPQFYASAGGPLAFAIDGVQCELGTFSSSVLFTTSAAVTRAADSLYWAFLPVPQAMTVYADFVDLGLAASGSSPSWYLFDIGTNATAAAFLCQQSGGKYSGQYYSAGGNLVATLGTTPAYGNRTEIRCALDALNATTMTAGQSINGAAETTATSATAGTYPSGFSQANLFVANAQNGSAPSFLALRSLKVASGVQTMTTMRAIP
jgi:hypothetical protein